MNNCLKVSGIIAQDQPLLTQAVEQVRSCRWSVALAEAYDQGVNLLHVVEIDADQCLYGGIQLTAGAVRDILALVGEWRYSSPTFTHEWMTDGRGEVANWLKVQDVWIGITDLDVQEGVPC